MLELVGHGDDLGVDELADRREDVLLVLRESLGATQGSHHFSSAVSGPVLACGK